MDNKILSSRRKKIALFQEFQCLDVIPYSIALLLLSGSIYILVAVVEITSHAK